MFFLASSALALASAFAAAFSSSVKSVRESMAASLAFSASSIDCLAAGLLCAVGLTEAMLVVPSVLAWSTSEFVVATSMFFLVSSAFALASAFAAAFSSSVKSVRESMADSLLFSHHRSLAWLLACFAQLGLLSWPQLFHHSWRSTSEFVVALSIACFLYLLSPWHRLSL